MIPGSIKKLFKLFIKYLVDSRSMALDNVDHQDLDEEHDDEDDDYVDEYEDDDDYVDQDNENNDDDNFSMTSSDEEDIQDNEVDDDEIERHSLSIDSMRTALDVGNHSGALVEVDNVLSNSMRTIESVFLLKRCNLKMKPEGTVWTRRGKSVPMPAQYRFSQAKPTFHQCLQLLAVMVRREDGLTDLIEDETERANVVRLWEMIYKLVILLLDHTIVIKSYQWRVLCERFGRLLINIYNIEPTSYLHIFIHHSGEYMELYGCLMMLCNIASEAKHGSNNTAIKASNKQRRPGQICKQQVTRDMIMTKLIEIYRKDGVALASYVSHSRKFYEDNYNKHIKGHINNYMADVAFRSTFGLEPDDLSHPPRPTAFKLNQMVTAMTNEEGDDYKSWWPGEVVGYDPENVTYDIRFWFVL
ncbi:hypothetical protein SAMD00019534_014440 [Acytostelium subglobosum LB1]|uniref:hypothetical protein n=1 Tax=Acytostelium subglobosum LB1 TaxID=1410327 RepID=UPI000644D343|nr:hypothetical protein SAMD00019534_014440 [Acytostelium subglobosum LB1]GAM18269.1 hypothetical protein SAMD00019534_014440 [Acytostelium subglobosum LB1]|eukprot:XP_012758865.1 hypothetical protein SAMD00019534_014440 [Acytostelium subglobosum LB1]